MRAEFSEFTYGFSIVHELATSLGCSAAPIFPSLRAEGQVGGGYDVHMDIEAVPFYLQFKLSEHLKTKNAKEAKASGGLLTAPYRRFPITSSILSDQHEMLVGLNCEHDLVFYCAPNYVTCNDLNRKWEDGNVAAHSVFVKPNDIGAIADGEKHTICFNNHSLHSEECYLFSDPKTLKTYPLDLLREDIAMSLENAETPLRELVPKWMESLDNARDSAHDLHRSRVAAIHKLQEERRLEKGDQDSDWLDYRAQIARRVADDVSPGIIQIETEIAPPDLPLRPLTGEKASNPEYLALLKFGQRVAIDFRAQAFVLQKVDVD